MKKNEKDYKEIYGDISTSDTKRLADFLVKCKLHKSKKDIFSEIKRINNIEWNTEKFIIYLLPKATPRPRSFKGSFFYVTGANDNKKMFNKAFKTWNCDMICTPCKFKCTSYFPIPSSLSPIDQILAEFGFIRPISKPDFDNIAKTYSDMIQGSLLLDDALIIEGISEKYYSWKPRIEISISYMKSFDSDYNRKKITGKKTLSENKLFNN